MRVGLTLYTKAFIAGTGAAGSHWPALDKDSSAKTLYE